MNTEIASQEEPPSPSLEMENQPLDFSNDREFFLPPEIIVHIFSFLDGESLLT